MTPFLGRLFPVTVDGRFKCDRCSRTYDTLVEAAECANPIHSQIRGGVVRRHRVDYAAKLCGGVRLCEFDPVPPRCKGGAKPKYATSAERQVARAAQQMAYWHRRQEAMTEADHDAEREARRARDRERSAEYRRQNADEVRQRERERSRRRRDADPEAAREAVRRSRQKWGTGKPPQL